MIIGRIRRKSLFSLALISLIMEKEIMMGLLDDLVKTGLSSVASGGQQGNMMAGLMELVAGQNTGGLGGLVQSFTQKGLGNIISSWVSTGQNLPISTDQLQNALGNDALSSFAQRAGVAPDAAGSLLSQILPNLVDKLTPEGKVPESGNLLEQGLSILKGMKF
jgi:uncharacterized protein YidB (DUF937 family)